MGATTARITAEDFLTPPEFAHWSLANHSAGRIGGVRLQLEADSDENRLAHCYQQIPLRVMPPFRFGPGQPSLIYLLNPTAGLMDGDGQLIQIRAREGTRAVIVGQSATRIHPAVRGFSTQQWQVHVEANAVLVILPGPAIPFQGARYYQRVRIDLEKGAGLIWGDLWYAGRYARGEASEQFQFETLIQDFTVYREERLDFRDRFVWHGPWDAQTASWHFGSHPACGSLFVTGPLVDSLLPSPSNYSRAIFRTGASDTCLRWLGGSEPITADLVTVGLRYAGILGGGKSPWLIPFQDLAPNHWFVPTHCPRDTVPFLDEAMGTPSGSGRPATSKS
jgi:urease accessory protein